MFMIKEIYYLIPEIFLSVVIILHLISYPALFLKKADYEKQENSAIELTQDSRTFVSHNAFLTSALFGLFITMAIILLLPVNEPVLLFHGQLIITPVTQLVKSIILLIVALLLRVNAFRVSFPYWSEIVILSMFIVLSSFFFVSANDFLVLWLSAEFQTFCFIFFAAINRNSMISLQSGIQFFAYSVFMSIAFLSAINELYGELGSISISDLQMMISEDQVPFYLSNQFLTYLTILSFFFFKFSIVPFHTWTVNVFEGAPLLLAGFLSTISKLSPFVGFTSLVIVFYSGTDYLFDTFFFLGVLSITVGTFGGFMELNMKRFLAYSSITHFGWLLIALASPTLNTLIFASFYFFCYLIITLSFLLIFFLIIPRFGAHNFNTLSAFEFLYPIENSVMLSTIVVLFSYVGMPPTSGFFQKMAVFDAYIEYGSILIPLLLIALTALGAFNYLRILIKTLVRRPAKSPLLLPFNFNLFIIYHLMSVLNLTIALLLPTIFHLLANYVGTSF